MGLLACATWALAGKLDLDLYSNPVDRGIPKEKVGESRPVRAFAQAGLTTLGAAGLGAELAGAGLCGPPCAVAFGLVAVINGSALWSTLHPPAPADAVSRPAVAPRPGR